eukprot:TRINITY_DN6689_c0_g1_i4.p1 TRINITY_DN6689_c0_g1~~TRINITY_DN6689_c0_g1_i4.p1  ORF type:complete len:464 (+),score=45.37 TRINITY_DN6689_c0_g1_i4:25-1416(+)
MSHDAMGRGSCSRVSCLPGLCRSDRTVPRGLCAMASWAKRRLVAAWLPFIFAAGVPLASSRGVATTPEQEAAILDDAARASLPDVEAASAAAAAAALLGVEAGGSVEEPRESGTEQPAWWSHAGCAEVVRRFDFNLNHSEADLIFKAYHRCLTHRSELSDWRSPHRPALLAGEHYPVAVTPSIRDPPGYWVTPAWDYVVSNFVRQMGTFEPGELQLYKALTKEGDVICDVGAHIGSYSVPLASHVGREGVVHAFEPFRLVSQLLTANVAVNGLTNVWVHQVAVGDVAEVRRIKSPSLEHSSNIGATRVFNQVPAHFETQNVLQYKGEENVRVITLDSMNLERLDFLKMDVEGALERALYGARETIRRHRPVLAVEWEGDAAPPMLEDWHYYCTKVLVMHDVWVCAPQERWWQHEWLGRSMDGTTALLRSSPDGGLAPDGGRGGESRRSSSSSAPMSDVLKGLG